MNITKDKEMDQAMNFLKQVLTPEQMVFSQAVSMCSVIVELGLQRASIEDVVDGFCERFEGMIERSHIEEVANNALAFGFEKGLFEPIDHETFTLSEEAFSYGENWLRQIKQTAWAVQLISLQSSL